MSIIRDSDPLESRAKLIKDPRAHQNRRNNNNFGSCMLDSRDQGTTLHTTVSKYGDREAQRHNGLKFWQHSSNPFLASSSC